MDLKEKQRKLEEIAKRVARCMRCGLHKKAVNPVPGEGNPNAEIMFLGEGPGYWEDRQGRPFVGQAGKLLDKLLQSIKLPREEVFIGNVLKHRPPENRDPLPEEIKACKMYLDEQIEIIDPKVIVTLGRFSMAKFLPAEYISRTHGQARYADFAGKRRIIIPMYHPAAALRSAQIEADLKSDFQKIPPLLKNLSAIKEDTARGQEETKKSGQLSLV